MFTDKRILITGGTGSWGNELTKQLLAKNAKEIVIFSRGEFAQVLMERKFNDNRLRFVIGDVRDFDALNRVCNGINYVFHLAALKHVPVCEYQPQEAIKTNINGTINLVNAAILNKVEKVIDVSTDKAVDPINLYGMTKAVGEKLIINANLENSNTKFVCIRGGNVLGSNGSVVQHFINNIKESNNINITDIGMTRFFLTIPEAISLLFIAAEGSIGGETFVMNMPACYIVDIAKELIKEYGNETTTITEIGIRPGEKLHEVLISKNEICNTYAYSDMYYMILPDIKLPQYIAAYNYYKSKYKQTILEEFNSTKQLMNEYEIRNMLINGGFVHEN